MRDGILAHLRDVSRSNILLDQCEARWMLL